MARILVVHIRYPEYDRCSGDLRLTNFLRILAEKHDVALHLLYQTPDYATAPENTHYRDLLEKSGVKVVAGSLRTHLNSAQYDAVVIEFWYVAKNIIRDIRILQPQARVIIDTEHIYFYSDYWKAKTLGYPLDTPASLAKKAAELNVYRRADLVLAVTEEDRRVLLAEDALLKIGVLPNIHDIPELAPDADLHRVPNRLVFVGNFSNNPANTDAMLWFCREVMPLVQKQIPQAHLQIVGNKPTPEVEGLASTSIEVTGFVPDVAPYLLASSVSICPLRFGAGLKGKIGEAMMYGLPVVTTSIGTQGMEARHSDNMMVGDTPADFAAGIVALLRNESLRARVAQNGRRFIIDKYSYTAVQQSVTAMVSALDTLPIQTYGVLKRQFYRHLDGIIQYIRWRFGT